MSKKKKKKPMKTKGTESGPYGMVLTFEELCNLTPSQEIIFSQVRTGTIRELAKKNNLDPDLYPTRSALINALPLKALNDLMDISRNMKGAENGASYYSLTLKNFHLTKKKE